MQARRRENILQRYVTPGEEIAFGGRNLVAKNTNLTSEEANRNILSYNYSYGLHRNYRRPKFFNPYFVNSPRQQVQCDLIDIKRLKQDNDAVQYLLVCIDIFSRFCWVQTMKNKSALVCKTALENVLEEMDPLLPSIIAVDRGLEFENGPVRQLLRNKNIKMIHPTSPTSKAAYAERMNQTLQNLIYKYLTEKQTNRYVNVLQNLVHTYNNRPHRSLNNKTPSYAERDINIPTMRSILWENRAKVIKTGRKMKPRFQVGDRVRIRKEQRVFDRGYNEKFTAEYFEVTSVNHRLPIPTYTLKSLDDGEVVAGDFYGNELQLTKGDVWKVEKVIKRRKRGRRNEVFVKWLGFGNRHNSWVDERDIQDV